MDLINIFFRDSYLVLERLKYIDNSFDNIKPKLNDAVLNLKKYQNIENKIVRQIYLYRTNIRLLSSSISVIINTIYYTRYGFLLKILNILLILSINYMISLIIPIESLILNILSTNLIIILTTILADTVTEQLSNEYDKDLISNDIFISLISSLLSYMIDPILFTSSYYFKELEYTIPIVSSVGNTLLTDIIWDLLKKEVIDINPIDCIFATVLGTISSVSQIGMLKSIKNSTMIKLEIPIQDDVISKINTRIPEVSSMENINNRRSITDGEEDKYTILNKEIDQYDLIGPYHVNMDRLHYLFSDEDGIRFNSAKETFYRVNMHTGCFISDIDELLRYEDNEDLDMSLGKDTVDNLPKIKVGTSSGEISYRDNGTTYVMYPKDNKYHVRVIDHIEHTVRTSIKFRDLPKELRFVISMMPLKLNNGDYARYNICTHKVHSYTDGSCLGNLIEEHFIHHIFNKNTVTEAETLAYPYIFFPLDIMRDNLRRFTTLRDLLLNTRFYNDNSKFIDKVGGKIYRRIIDMVDSYEDDIKKHFKLIDEMNEKDIFNFSKEFGFHYSQEDMSNVEECKEFLKSIIISKDISTKILRNQKTVYEQIVHEYINASLFMSLDYDNFNTRKIVDPSLLNKLFFHIMKDEILRTNKETLKGYTNDDYVVRYQQIAEDFNKYYENNQYDDLKTYLKEYLRAHPKTKNPI